MLHSCAHLTSLYNPTQTHDKLLWDNRKQGPRAVTGLKLDLKLGFKKGLLMALPRVAEGGVDTAQGTVIQTQTGQQEGVRQLCQVLRIRDQV